MTYKLQEVALMQLKATEMSVDASSFVIEPLAPGFGLTLGNALRRVLLSSLEGAAITSVRIEGASHEFATLKGVTEDVVDIILNLKQLKFRFNSDEPQTIVLDQKGPKKVTGKDLKCPTGVEIANKDAHIAELVKGGKLLLEATVERGRGYVPTELRRDESLPIGVIAVDAAFSPITRVNFQTEHTRVGKMTNFDKLVIEIETDGTITPHEALSQSAQILVEHFNVLAGSDEQASPESTEKPAAKKTATGSRKSKAKPADATESKKSSQAKKKTGAK